MSFFRNVMTTLSSSVLSIPIAVASSVLLARGLSVSDRGVYSLATTFAALVAVLMHLSWGAGSIYRLKRAGSQPASVASLALLSAMSLALIGVGACLIARDVLIDSFLPGVSRPIFSIALILMAITIASTIFSNLARGIDRFGIANFHTLFSGIISFSLLAYVILGRNGGVLDAIAALAVAQGIAGCILIAAVLYRTGFQIKPSPLEAVETLRFGIKTHVQNVAGRVHERLDLFLIAFYLEDTRQVAFYTIAVGLISRVKIIPDSIGKVLFPRIAGDSPEQAAAFTAFASRHSLLWVTLIALGLLALGPVLIPVLYGPSYSASVLPFLTLLPGAVMLTIYKIFARYFMATGHQRVNVASQCLATGLNLALNVVFIPQFGILGAAIASLISYSLSTFIVAIVFVRKTQIPFKQTILIDRDDLKIYADRIANLIRR